MERADSMKVTALDWIVVGAGLLAYTSIFFPWRQTRVSFLGTERLTDADDVWSAGFGAWFSVLLLLAAGVVVLASTMVARLATSRPLITLGLSTLALITILLRWVTLSDAGGGREDLGEIDLGEIDLGDIDVDGLFAVSSGAGSGLYLGLIAAVVAVVASFSAWRRVARSDRS